MVREAESAADVDDADESVIDAVDETVDDDVSVGVAVTAGKILRPLLLDEEALELASKMLPVRS